MDPVIVAALMVGLPLWSGLIAWPAGVRKIETTSR
jgi:hypothetical protein